MDEFDALALAAKAKKNKALLVETFGSENAAIKSLTGDIPEGQAEPEKFFPNPNTGQMTSSSLLTNHHILTAPKNDKSANTEVIKTMAPHGATLGFSDEAAYLGNRIRGADEANFAMENQRAKIDASREEHPILSLAAEVVGSLGIPVSLFRDAMAAKTAGQAVKTGAKGGVVAGGTYSFGEGEGGLDRFRDVPAGAVTGALGGVVAVPVGKAVIWAAKTLGKPMARLFSSPQYYNEATGLTAAGKEAARALGHDPDVVTEKFAREFGQGLEKGIDPSTSAAAAEFAEFDVPAYKHNVTEDVNDFADFERARVGAAGEQAKNKVVPAAEAQFDASQQAIDNAATKYGGGVRGDQLDAGQAVVNRLESIKAAEKAAASAAYKASDDAGLAIDPNVASGVAQRIQTKLAADEIDITLDIFQKTRSFMARLEKRGQGDNPVSLRLIDGMRKDLNKAMAKADSEDMRGLTIIKNEYDQWVDDVVEAKLFTGDAAGLDELKNARALWAEYAKKYTGKDAGAKFVRDMIDRDASPEQVTKWLFGTSKLGGGRMNSKLATTLKEHLGEGSDEWNMLRQAAFRQLTQKPGTEDIGARGVIRWGPQKVGQNIHSFIRSPSTRPLADALFTKAEQAEMLRLGAVFRRMTPPKGASNPSGTAYELSRMGQKAWSAIVASVGFSAGGPAGAATAHGSSKAVGAGASWLRGRRLLQQPKAPKKPSVSAGGVRGGAVGSYSIATELFPFLQEQESHP